MSWDADFYAACMSNSSFSSGVTSLAYEYKADAVAPFARYQLINANSIDDLDQAHRTGERLIQLTTYAETPLLAKQLAEYGAAGAQSGLSVLSIYERSLGRDPDENIHGYAIDLLVWFSNP